MKDIPSLFCLVAGAGLALIPVSAHAQTQLSAANLDFVDQLGWFTPGFKTAVHEFVDTKQAIAAAQKEDKDVGATLPGLQKQAVDAQSQVATLKAQLALYSHTDQSDFDQLQKLTSDPAAKPDDLRRAAQAYLWAYPVSPHLAGAQEILQTVQKKIADQVQAEKDAAAARAAARALLVQRAEAKQLSLGEWRDFLRDMTQAEVLQYLGKPNYQNDNYWTYTGEWTDDPDTHQKIGLQVNFIAARVNGVSKGAVK